MAVKPKIEDAPGLTWRVRTDGTIVARWIARADLVRRGYLVKTVALWEGQMPEVADVAHIQQRCRDLQDEMLIMDVLREVKSYMQIAGSGEGQ